MSDLGKNSQTGASSVAAANKVKRAALKATASVVFSLILLFLVSFTYLSINDSLAWFSSNKNVSADGMGINVKTPEEIEATVELFPVSSKTNDTLYFDTTTQSDGVMPQYDILDETNRHVLLRISFAQEEVPLSVVLTANTDTDYFMDGETHPLLAASLGSSGEYQDNNTVYDNCMSSIICFANVEADSVILNDGKYSFTLPTEDSLKAFANEGNDGNISITQSVELVNGSISEIFILISYNEENISRIYSENIGNEAFSNEGVLENGIIYKPDFSFNLSLA